MQNTFNLNTSKQQMFDLVKERLLYQQIKIVEKDSHRPWGGFFVIDENDGEKFINLYFSHFSKEELSISGKLSPKILIVAPGKRLSWQYHLRRSEIWRFIEGEAKLVTSDNDEETEETILYPGDTVQLAQGGRHRLIGGENNWGIVAEIWQHTDIDNPSNEDDIIRLQDDFGR